MLTIETVPMKTITTDPLKNVYGKKSPEWITRSYKTPGISSEVESCTGLEEVSDFIMYGGCTLELDPNLKTFIDHSPENFRHVARIIAWHMLNSSDEKIETTFHKDYLDWVKSGKSSSYHIVVKDGCDIEWFYVKGVQDSWFSTFATEAFPA